MAAGEDIKMSSVFKVSLASLSLPLCRNSQAAHDEYKGKEELDESNK
jgi:hypothetical protein